MSAELREARADDAPELARVAAAALPEAWSADELARTLGRAETRARVARFEGRAVGFALARLCAGDAEILALAVEPGARRRGLGSALLAALVASLRADGAERISLEVRSGNHAARRLYEGQGFRAAGVRARYYGDGEDALLLGVAL